MQLYSMLRVKVTIAEIPIILQISYVLLWAPHRHASVIFWLFSDTLGAYFESITEQAEWTFYTRQEYVNAL